MKYNLSFGGGADSIMYDLEKNEFYNLEKDLEFDADCEMKYKSRSGLSGEGFYRNNDEIRFGYIRIDCNGEQNPEIIYSVEDQVELFTYVTIKSHKGIQPFKSHPQLIITDGNKILFLSLYRNDDDDIYKIWDKNKFKKFILNWNKAWGQEEKITFQEKIYHPENLEEIQLNFQATKDNYLYRGWNLKRFLSIKEYRFNIPYEDYNPIQQLAADNRIYLYRDKFILLGFRNLIIAKSDNLRDLLLYKCGYDETASGAFYKLKWNNGNYHYYSFVIKQGLEKYENQVKFFEYEVTSNYFRGKNYFEKELRKGVLRKIRMDFVTRKRKEIDKKQIYYFLLLTKEKIDINESVKTGNCLVGTKRFLDEHNIKINNDKIKPYDLVKNIEVFNKMIENYNFTKVVKNIMKNSFECDKKEKIKVLYDNYVEKANDWNQNHSFDGYGFDNIRLEPCEFSEFTKDYYNKYKNNFYRIYANEYDLIYHVYANLSLDKLTEEIEYIMRDI